MYTQALCVQYVYIVADTRIVINQRAVYVLIREPVYMKMRQLLSRPGRGSSCHRQWHTWPPIIAAGQRQRKELLSGPALTAA